MGQGATAGIWELGLGRLGERMGQGATAGIWKLGLGRLGERMGQGDTAGICELGLGGGRLGERRGQGDTAWDLRVGARNSKRVTAASARERSERAARFVPPWGRGKVKTHLCAAGPFSQDSGQKSAETRKQNAKIGNPENFAILLFAARKLSAASVK